MPDEGWATAGLSSLLPCIGPLHMLLTALVQEREREKELALIKAQYLGAEKKKKKVLKGAEKFKFNFDWEAGDDTSRDLNPLYNQTHGRSLRLLALPLALARRCSARSRAYGIVHVRLLALCVASDVGSSCPLTCS